MLKTAEQLLPSAKLAADKAHYLATPDASLSGLDAARQQLANLRALAQAVATDPNAGKVAAATTTINGHIRDADTVLKTPTPEESAIAEAAQHCKDGIETALQAQKAMLDWKFWKATFQAIGTRASSVDNTDDCVKTELDKFADLKSQADTLEASSTPDFAQASALAVQANEQVLKAETLSPHYKDFKAKKDAVNTAITEVKLVDGFDKLETKIRTDLDDDHAKALRLGDPTGSDRKYAEAVELMKDLEKRVPMLKKYADGAYLAYLFGNYSDRTKFDPYRGKPETAKDVIWLDKQADDMDEAKRTKSHQLAGKIGLTISMRLDTIEAFAKRYKGLADSLAEVDVEYTTLDGIKNDGISEELTAITAAKTEATAKLAECRDNIEKRVMNMDALDTLLPKLKVDIAAAKLIVPAYAAYVTARDAARAGRAELAKQLQEDQAAGRYNKTDQFELRERMIETWIAEADAKGTAKDYVAAKAIYDKVAPVVAEIKTLGAQAAPIGNAQADLKGAAETAEALTPELEKAQALFVTLKSQIDTASVSKLVNSIDTSLGTIASYITAEKFADAKTELDLTLWKMEYAHTLAAQLVTFKTAEAAAAAALKTAQEHECAACAVSMSDTAAFELGMARTNADAHILTAAYAGLQSCEQKSQEALDCAIGRKEYQEKLAPLAPKVKDLAKHAGKHAIDTEFKELQKMLRDAQDLSIKLDHPAAIAKLSEAADAYNLAILMAKMHANAEPDPATIEAILQGPDGTKKLDAIIEKLDPQTQRKVVTEAFKLRFGVDLIMQNKDGAVEDSPADLAKKAPNIMKLYDVMSGVPDLYTKDSPSMKVVQREGDQTAVSSFNTGTKALKLQIGRADSPQKELLIKPNELPDVEEQYKPKDVKADYFSFTALHEIGHSIDDRASFMASRASGEAYGSWTEYGSNVAPIAKKVAGEFNYDAAYLESYMLNGEGSAPIPEAPGGVDADEWERCRIRATVWCDSVRHNKSIWHNGGACKKLALDDVVYQESYSNSWTSYDLQARTRGVTGYQFRAPGEWFAELYAAYHSGVLADNHPAESFLKQFGEPKKR